MTIELGKKSVSMKLSADARALIEMLGQKHGMKATAVVESAVRLMAEKHGVVPEKGYKHESPENE